MKAYKTVIFIFSVLGILALISVLFPVEGIKAGPIMFEFPPLTEILAVNEPPAEPEISPEELLQQRLDALVASRDNEFLEFMKTSEARFYLPNGDVTFFDNLFMKLENCGDGTLRIVHYGDSQIEEDRMTSYLRERFQEQFGGSGVGMLAAVPKSGATFTCVQGIEPKDRIPYYLAYGPASARAGHRRYGPMAQVAHIDTTTVISFRTRQPEDFPHAQTFQHVKVRVQGGGNFSFTANNVRTPLTCDTTKTKDDVRVYEAVLPTPAKKGTLVISGYCDIQSIQLDGTSGVAMDNVAMRGCSGTVFTAIDRKSLQSFFEDENVGLIILQYGGNSVPYIKSEKAIEKFCEDTKKQIELFRQISPTSTILYIGPSDMSTSIGGQMQTYPHLPDFIQALQKAVNEAGAAYWNMFEAMGGKNSMVAWVKAKPQLAGGDYIHFTPKGARQISEILYGTFDIYYKYYRFRKYERYNMADSLSVESVGL